ncbi:MAG: hypothetical protein K1X92_10480 [Bacteroidia bacterium]|nr:hypothetical protein [Bacteroidia bacterium]
MTHFYYLRHIIEQIEYLAENLNDSQFSEPLQVLNNASIGKHIRHIIDVFETVASGADQESISFDKRSRNTSVENDKSLAVNTLKHWSDIIEKMNLNKKVLLVNNFSLETEEDDICTETTLIRELVYAIEHAIHHLAIIKIGASQSFGLSFSSDFGVAPSTIRHYKQQQSGSRG